MEICEKGEMFIEKGDDFTFDHTKIILQGVDGEFYYAKTGHRIWQSSDIDVRQLDLIKILADRVWPLADPKFTRAPDPLPSSSFVKRPSLLYYEDTPDHRTYSCQILTDVEACEILRRHPHPNIAQYLGCIVQDGRIRGLAFTKYPTTLSQVLKDGLLFNRGRCLLGIEAGVSHMHHLGLIHNDLNPSNIMMVGDDPVIIDFDSCKQEGQKLGLKSGTPGWTRDGEDYARRENDSYSLSRIRMAVMKEGKGSCI